MDRYMTIDTGIAVECGLEAALIYSLIESEVDAYRKVNANRFDDNYWVRMPREDIIQKLPIIKPYSISRSLANLIASGYLIEGIYNEDSFDRTKWYAKPIK